MLVAGIDVGSTATKVVLLADREIHSALAPTGWSPRQTGTDTYQGLLRKLGLSEEQVAYVVGTGYGRISLPFIDQAVTEITCHARGVAGLLPGTSLVIDVGGQDSKVIKTGPRGEVLDFVMNDKCAAGTGRFLQVIAATLGVEVNELSDLAENKPPLPLNSMCAVFAESEVIGLLAANRDKGEIISGLHHSVAQRIATLAQRLGPPGKTAFTGGVAKNAGVRQCLETLIGVKVTVPENCQLTGALGAAFLARDFVQRTKNNK
ncbi:MAG: acyl-CoA dehydratase activase [Heliobacteriaceae bacterium]|nr:acyl-CoA dehydratase activase [Heliobacteriaceae bacterium]MDD4588523.1 acyl-CoA dehydratase activase [Heliobacteriaceae bacterium]